MNRENKGMLAMMGFAIFTAIGYLTADFGLHFFLLSVPNAIFWGFFTAIVLSAPFYLGIPHRRKGIQQCLSRHFWLLFGLSAMIFVGASLWFLMLSHSNSGIISLLDKSEILFATAFGVIFLGERISAREFFGISIAGSGIVFISNFSGEISFFSSLIVLFVSFLYATQSFLTKKFAPEVDGFSFAFLRGVFILFFTGLFFAFRGEITLVPFPAIVTVGFGQLCSLVIARVFYFEAHRFLPIFKLNFFRLLIPIFVLVGGFLVFPEYEFSPQKMLGMTLTLGGFGFFLWVHFAHRKK